MEIKRNEIIEMIGYFSKLGGRFSTYSEDTRMDLQDKCLNLFQKDYHCTVLNNEGGCLCTHYPDKLILCNNKDLANEERPCLNKKSLQDLTEMIRESKYARCRERFVFPVIVMKDKNVYRSGTLSSSAVFDEKFTRTWTTKYQMKEKLEEGSKTNGILTTDNNDNEVVSEEKSLLYRNKKREKDVELLKYFNIQYICDLMVESKKNTKGVIISSSEKIDKYKRYKDFDILGTPYPGCEWFCDLPKIFNEGVVYDWNMDFVNAELILPEDAKLLTKEIEWTKYKEWDLVTLNENYLLLLIRILAQRDGGMLIHCISGWHRTPMFISLIRLSMWADGEIHESLSVTEILYLTLAYDWFLFGHDFSAALRKGESMLRYSFLFIKKMYSAKYSFYGDKCTKELAKEREKKLMAVHDLYHEVSNGALSMVKKKKLV